MGTAVDCNCRACSVEKRLIRLLEVLDQGLGNFGVLIGAKFLLEARLQRHRWGCEVEFCSSLTL